MGKITVPNVKLLHRFQIWESRQDPARMGYPALHRRPRGTDAYKKIYNQRTATERINNRILNDYGLHRMFIHTKEHYSFMTTMIGICIHLDARYKQQVQAVA